MGPKTKTRPKTKKQSKKTPHNREICKSKIDEIVTRRTFEPYLRPSVGCRFLRFTTIGQIVTGRLGYPVKNFRQGTSYPLELNNGEIVEIVGNRLPHEQIRKGELSGRRIKIVYQGREFIYGGHHRKIFRIYVTEEQPIFSKAQWARILKAAERKKNAR